MSASDPELAGHISQLDDHDLLRMITVDAGLYRPEAIALGRAEAERRGPTP